MSKDLTKKKNYISALKKKKKKKDSNGCYPSLPPGVQQCSKDH
jgi:hypothetical protein